MKHKLRCRYTICHIFKATKSVLLLNTCFKETRDFFIHCKARNTVYGIRLTCTMCVRKKDINNNNTPKVGRRACHGVSEIQVSPDAASCGLCIRCRPLRAASHILRRPEPAVQCQSPRLLSSVRAGMSY